MNRQLNSFERSLIKDRIAYAAAFGRYINILKEEIHGTENK